MVSCVLDAPITTYLGIFDASSPPQSANVPADDERSDQLEAPLPLNLLLSRDDADIQRRTRVARKSARIRRRLMNARRTLPRIRWGSMGGMIGLDS